MVVCKFFLQGNCKFGDFCKFEHQLNDNYQNSPSILRQSQFGNAQQQSKPNTVNTPNVDTNTLVKSVVNDMKVAEKGGQWLLSRYAPFKEKPAFPGFEDHSFEEIRLGYYEAVKSGTLEQYKQQVQMMLQQAVMRMKSLQSPSPDIVNILKCIYCTPPASYSGVYGSNITDTTAAFGNAANTSGVFSHQQPSPFGQQPNSSAFAQSGQNIFGKPAQPQNQFGGTGTPPQNQIFTVQTNNPIFGNNQGISENVSRQANNSFGTQGNTSIFATQPITTQGGTGSIFSGVQPTNNSTMFGGVGPTSGSLFGGQATASSIFGGQQSVPHTFSPPTQPSNSNIFGNSFHNNQNPSSSFGKSMFGVSPNPQTFGSAPAAQNMPQQASASIFAMNQPQNTQKSVFAQQEPSIFSLQSTETVSNQQTTNSPFGHMPSGATDATSHSNSIFGSGQNTVAAFPPFGVAQQVDESLYSKLEDLTEDEIKWFNSGDLDVLNIPEKPPTYQMCFKT